jgi:hypothetical protein
MLTQASYTVIADEFELGYTFSVSQEKNKPLVEFNSSLDLFCRTPLQRSFCAFFRPLLESSLKTTVASIVKQVGGTLE